MSDYGSDDTSFYWSTFLSGCLIVPIAERMAYNILMIAIFFIENPNWEKDYDTWDLFE